MRPNIKKVIKIDRTSPVPMYYQIYKSIVKLIKNGTFAIGEQIPTEMDLCVELDVSRPTVRQALQELINGGYVIRKKAKGTFVCKPKVEGYFFRKLESYNEEMKALHLIPSTIVEVQEVIQGEEEVVQNLKLEEGQNVLHLLRLRFADHEPMVYVHTYVPCFLFPGIEAVDFSSEEISLYDHIMRHYQTRIAYVDRSIEAMNASVELADKLELMEGQAIYTVTTIAYSNDDVPVEYSIAYYRGDRNKFTIRLLHREEEE